MEVVRGADVIPILGMHRSGTSALAGALHKLGADLGPESEWIYPAADNPLGFFEYEPLVAIDREVFAALGGTWSSPPAFAPGWVDDDRISAQREQAEQLLSGLPANMVVKDPRLSLVQPLWDQVGQRQQALLCVRHPASVAGSLQARNHFSVEEGLFLWFRYNAASLINRPDALVVHYERLLGEPELQLRLVAEHIGLEIGPTSLEAAARSVHGTMAHHEASSLPSTPIGDVCSALYNVLQSGRQLSSAPDVYMWARLATELPWAGPSDREILLNQRALRQAQLEIVRMKDENERYRQRLERLDAELRRCLATVDGVSFAGAASLLPAPRDGAR